jgi:hypothetical protein
VTALTQHRIDFNTTRLTSIKEHSKNEYSNNHSSGTRTEEGQLRQGAVELERPGQLYDVITRKRPPCTKKMRKPQARQS